MYLAQVTSSLALLVKQVQNASATLNEIQHILGTMYLTAMSSALAHQRISGTSMQDNDPFRI
jgi:hypothetical protein